MLPKFEVIIDNAGGVTFETPDFSCSYTHRPEITLCANDIRALLSGADPSEWEGNRPNERRNGQYHAEDVVLDADDVAAIIKAGKAIGKLRSSNAGMELVNELLGQEAWFGIKDATL